MNLMIVLNRFVRLTVLYLVTVSVQVHAIAIRHDLDEQLYFDLGASYEAVGMFLYPWGAGCTGTLVEGNKVVSAAHCFDFDGDGSVDIAPNDVSFNLGNDVYNEPTHSIFASSIAVQERWRNPRIYDLAVVTLSILIQDVVPMLFNPYSTFGNPGSPSQVGVAVGFGHTGTGLGPTLPPDGKKRGAVNEILMGHHNDQLVIDFDDPSSVPPTGLPWLEGSPCLGDSGGPLLNPVFPNSPNPKALGQIVGVSSYVDSEHDPATNCTYGMKATYSWIGTDVNVKFLEDNGLNVFRVPEPPPAFLIGLGLVALGWSIRKPASADF